MKPDPAWIDVMKGAVRDYHTARARLKETRHAVVELSIKFGLDPIVSHRNTEATTFLEGYIAAAEAHNDPT